MGAYVVVLCLAPGPVGEVILLFGRSAGSSAVRVLIVVLLALLWPSMLFSEAFFSYRSPTNHDEPCLCSPRRSTAVLVHACRAVCGSCQHVHMISVALVYEGNYSYVLLYQVGSIYSVVGTV